MIRSHKFLICCIKIFKINYLSAIFFFSILFVFIDSAKAPPCVIRSPDKHVYTLYPDATNYKVIFRDVSPERQLKIERYLGNPLGYGERGAHCIYLVFKEDKPIGFIHPRSESGKYGAIEILWAYNPEGKIKDFIIQRSREPKTNELRSESFRSQFRDKSLKTPFILIPTNEINKEIMVPIKGAEEVSYIIAYSAMKVGAFMEFVFMDVINEVKGIEADTYGSD